MVNFATQRTRLVRESMGAMCLLVACLSSAGCGFHVSPKPSLGILSSVKVNLDKALLAALKRLFELSNSDASYKKEFETIKKLLAEKANPNLIYVERHNDMTISTPILSKIIALFTKTIAQKRVKNQLIEIFLDSGARVEITSVLKIAGQAPFLDTSTAADLAYFRTDIQHETLVKLAKCCKESPTEILKKIIPSHRDYVSDDLVQFVEYLISHGADPLAHRSDDGDCVLHHVQRMIQRTKEKGVRVSDEPGIYQVPSGPIGHFKSVTRVDLRCWTRLHEILTRKL